MRIQITTLGASKARTYGHRRLTVLSAAILPWCNTEADIAKTTGFSPSTVTAEMRGLYATGAIVNRTNKRSPVTKVPSASTGRVPHNKYNHITDAQVLSTYQALKDKTATGRALGLSRGAVRSRLDTMVARSKGALVL